jgi:hypothetical protein
MFVLLWLKLHNHLYGNIPVRGVISDVDEVQESLPTNENCLIPTDYVPPHVNISSAVNDHSCYFFKQNPLTDSITICEEMAFPWLFLNGVNGFLSQRPMNSFLKEYFQTRMNIISGIFCKDITYLLSALNVSDYKRMHSTISIHVAMSPICS